VFYETMPSYLAFQCAATYFIARRYAARADHRGMTTETVIITALLAVAALTVGGIILSAVTKKGQTVKTDIEQTPTSAPLTGP
jgi:hypothetical protein